MPAGLQHQANLISEKNEPGLQLVNSPTTTCPVGPIGKSLQLVCLSIISLDLVFVVAEISGHFSVFFKISENLCAEQMVFNINNTVSPTDSG